MSTCSPPPLMFGSSLMTAARHCICQPESILVAPNLNEPFIWGKKGRGEGMTKLVQVRGEVHTTFPQVLLMTKSEPVSWERRQTHLAHTWAHSMHKLGRRNHASSQQHKLKGWQLPATPCRSQVLLGLTANKSKRIQCQMLQELLLLPGKEVLLEQSSCYMGSFYGFHWTTFNTNQKGLPGIAFNKPTSIWIG